MEKIPYSGKCEVIFDIVSRKSSQKIYHQYRKLSLYPFKIYDKLVCFFLTDFYLYPCKIC